MKRRDFLKQGARGAGLIMVSPFLLNTLHAGAGLGLEADLKPLFGLGKEDLDKLLRQTLEDGGDFADVYLERRLRRDIAMEERIEEARRAGLKVAAHAVSDQGFYNAAAAGVASIEHGFEASDASLKKAKKNRVVLVGTDLTKLATKLWEADEIYRLAVIDRTRRARRIGVEMAFGSDVFYSWPERTRGRGCCCGEARPSG